MIAVQIRRMEAADAEAVSCTEQQEGIRIQKITLKDNSREYPHVLEVKEKIMKFYEVDSSQIQIAVQED